MNHIYVVNCYTCQHNGRETCKGCNTLLVGENEIYENWQLREDLEIKDQRIAELEKQLKNAIVPKFKRGQDVWCVYPTNEHRQGFVFELEFVGYTKDKIICRITDNEEFEYDEVFATKEQAQAKLKELQGE